MVSEKVKYKCLEITSLCGHSLKENPMNLYINFSKSLKVVVEFNCLPNFQKIKGIAKTTALHFLIRFTSTGEEPE